MNLESFVINNNSNGLIIHDEGDTICNVNSSKNLHSVWPNSELVLTNGLGHTLDDEDIVDTVKQFIYSSAA